MKVRSFMTPGPMTVLPDETADEAWGRMGDIEARHLPVVEDGVLLGIVSDRDIVGGFDLEVSEVMTPDPVVIGPEDDLIEAGRLMLSNRISALPVVEDGKLVGVLTTTNCLTAMMQLHHQLDLSRHESMAPSHAD